MLRVRLSFGHTIKGARGVTGGWTSEHEARSIKDRVTSQAIDKIFARAYIPIHFAPLPRGVSRWSVGAGRVRWTRQRRARREGGRGCRGRGAQGPARPGVCGAAGPQAHDDDAVRCGPGRRCAPSASLLRAGPSRAVLTPSLSQRDGVPARRPAAGHKVRTLSSALLSPDGDERKRINRRRGEHEASRKPHRVRNAGRFGAFVVTDSRACLLCA